MSTETAIPPMQDKLTAEAVITYLRRNPDFLDKHPELLQTLTPPSYQSGDSVVDMQRYMMERLRSDIEAMQREFGELIFSARDNLSVQSQIHTAVIHLLRAASLEDLVTVTATDLPAVFNVDTVQICLESDIAPRNGTLHEDSPMGAMRYIPTGMINELFGNEKVVLGNLESATPVLFGEAAPLAASCALVKLPLSVGGRSGILGFGVRDRMRFHPGQGTELLQFLGDVMTYCLDQWLARP